MTSHMQYYTFRISINGIKRITDELEDKVFEAGMSDALISVRKGIVYLDFTRQDPSFLRAVNKAEKQINSITLKDMTKITVRGLHII